MGEKELKYPRGEIVWVEYRNKDGKTLFILTSKETRDMYFLYELVNGVFNKLGKAKEPPELEKKFLVRERMRA